MGYPGRRGRCVGGRVFPGPIIMNLFTWRRVLLLACVIAASVMPCPAADEAALRLTRPKLTPLPLGAIKPAGWLRRQLEIQADGLTGHLQEFWPDIRDSGWIGGKAEGWERFPYWLDGAVPLSHLLDREPLKTYVTNAVDHILRNQQPDGWLGPVAYAGPGNRVRDPWPVFVAMKVLTQHAEATGDERVKEALVKFLAALDRQLDERPLDEWNRMRWQDAVLSLHWLRDHGGDSYPPHLFEKLRGQGFDWVKHLSDLPIRDKVTKWDHASHVVNIAMGVKAPAVQYRETGDAAELGHAVKMVEQLDRFHGQATGVFSGDECLAGRMPSQGTETCAVVEYMFSLEHLLAAFGDPRFADRLEMIAFNALPASMSDDMWTRQYIQQVNQPVSRRAPKPIYTTNGDRANLFGLETNFGCCTANMHQGWPKFVSHLWMRDDRGLTAVAYAPCTVQTEVAGTTTTVAVDTQYPFRERIAISVTVDKPARFAIALRIPAWCTAARLAVADEPSLECSAGSFHSVERDWHGTTQLVLDLPMLPQVERRERDAVVLRRGPLLLALGIGADWQVLDGAPPKVTYQVLPTTPWNYALEIDAADPAASIRLEQRSLGDVPFGGAEPAVVATVKGRRVPAWDIERDAAMPPPQSPVHSEEPLVDLTLIPYAAAKLRITEFPVLER